MKKIVLTINRATIARNLLQNDFYHELKKHFQIIILSPAAREKKFLEIFGGQFVSFLALPDVPHSFADRICVGFHRYLLFDKFMALKVRYGIRGVSRPEEASWLRYLIFMIVFTPLAKIGFLKKVIRWFDYHFVQRAAVKKFQKFLRDEKVDLVLATSILANTETILAKAAKKNRLPLVGMVKSWDNPSKMSLRIVPDKLVVWSNFMAKQFIKLQQIPPDCLAIVGIPQFDDYVNPAWRWPRERFCRLAGLDPGRPIILYTSAGKGIPEDEAIVALIVEGIQNGLIDRGHQVQLFIRPHFKYHNDAAKFTRFTHLPFVFVDQPAAKKSTSAFRDQIDFDREFTTRLINTLYHSAVVVNVASTMTLDAAAFNKPSVHPMLKEVIGHKPPGDSYLMFYESDYIKALQATGASEIAKTKTELYQAINRALKNPQILAAERKAMIKEFCYQIDGQSGRRLAEVLKNCLP